MKKKPTETNLSKLVETTREENTPQEYPEEWKIIAICSYPLGMRYTWRHVPCGSESLSTYNSQKTDDFECWDCGG